MWGIASWAPINSSWLNVRLKDSIHVGRASQAPLTDTINDSIHVCQKIQPMLGGGHRQPPLTATINDSIHVCQRNNSCSLNDSMHIGASIDVKNRIMMQGKNIVVELRKKYNFVIFFSQLREKNELRSFFSCTMFFLSLQLRCQVSDFSHRALLITTI